MFKIGLDLGYGYIKGVNESGREVLFPSLVCDGYDRQLSGLFGGGLQSMKDNLHFVVSDETNHEIFVGDLARREGGNISFAFDENKINHPDTRGLLAAASYLLFPDGHIPVHLVTGLPFEQYVHHKNEFSQMLGKFNVTIRHKNTIESKRINFAKTTIFPQAAGAFYYAILADLEKYMIPGSYLGLVDIGFKTTDFITFYIEGVPVFRKDLSGTIYSGISDVQFAVDKMFTAKTGSKLNIPNLMFLTDNGRILFDGKELNFSKEIEDAKQKLAKNIKDKLKIAWGTDLKFFHTMFLAGGGSTMLGHALSGLHPNTTMVGNPQFANAKGFLKVAEQAARRAATG